MTDIDVLMELYKEQRELGLHHERQRQAVTGFFLTVAAILLSIIGMDDELNSLDIPMAVFVIVAGVFGAVVTLKHYERFEFHRKRSRKLRKAIDAALAHEGNVNPSVAKLRDEIRRTLKLPSKNALLVEELVHEANTKYKANPPRLYRQRLHELWIAVNLFIAAIGTAVLTMIIVNEVVENTAPPLWAILVLRSLPAVPILVTVVRAGVFFMRRSKQDREDEDQDSAPAK